MGIFEPAIGPSFGGQQVELNPVPEDQKIDLNAGTPPVAPQSPVDGNKIDLGAPPTVDPKVAADRASKAHMGLGDLSPGYDALKQAIASGHEDSLRQVTASQQSMRNAESNRQLIEELMMNNKPTPEAAEVVKGVATSSPTENPATHWEKSYAGAVVNRVLAGLHGAQEVFADVTNIGAERHDADVANAMQGLIAAKELETKWAEEYESKLSSMGVVKRVTTWLGANVPFLPWYRVTQAVKDTPMDKSWGLYGSTIGEFVQWAGFLTPDQLQEQVKPALDKLAEANPETALYLSQALVSYSTSSQNVDNIFTAVDLGTTVSPFAIAKGAAAIAKGTAKAVVKGAGKSLAERAGIETIAGTAGKGLKALKEGYTKGLVEDLVHGAEAPVKKAMADAAKAVEGPVTDPVKILNAAGDTHSAAKLDVVRMVTDDIKDPVGERRGLLARMPSIFNPQYIGADLGNLSREAADTIIDTMRLNGKKLVDLVNRPELVDRTFNESVLMKMVEEATEKLKDRTSHVSNSVLDVSQSLPEHNMANVGSVTMHIGTPERTVFETRAKAVTYALNNYKLKGFTVNQRGSGYTIDITKHFDETSDGVRGVIGETEHTPKQVIPFIEYVRSASGLVPAGQTKQRLTATYSQGEMHRIIADVIKPIQAVKDKTGLIRVLEADRAFETTLDDGTVKYGRNLLNIHDFEDEYSKLNGKLPSAQEAAAYFTHQQLMDMDYWFRNLTLFRDKTRLGIEHAHLKIGDTRLKIEGKDIDRIPDLRGEGSNGILKINEDGTTTFKTARQTSNERIKELQAEGYRIVQVASPGSRPWLADEDLKAAVGTNRSIHYILTKDVQYSPLTMDQLPKQEGPHIDYAVRHFVKQPKIERYEDQLDNGRTFVEHSYEGDVAALGFDSAAEAKKYTELFNQGRKLLNDRAALEAFLEKNIPMTADEFELLFKGTEEHPARFSPDMDFVSLEAGQRAIDRKDLAEGWKKQSENFVDNIRNPANLYDQLDKKYAGERDPRLWSIDENAFKMSKARLVDPMVTLNHAMGNVMRSRLMSDYKIQAMEQFASEFWDLMNIPKDTFMSNPGYYIHNADFVPPSVENTQRLAMAQASRRAILSFLGTESPIKHQINLISSKLADMAYSTGGQKWSRIVSDINLFKATDPFVYTRSIAFHSKMGLFNPIHLFKQAQNVANAFAIAPREAIPAAASATMMRMLGYTENPKIIDHFAGMASKFGVSKETFKESLQYLKDSGVWNVEGEHAFRDSAFDPQFITNRGKRFLDAGLVFFREGDRLSRLTAHNAAFFEWRRANPTAELNRWAKQEIRARADTMTVNMTRAGNAFWNSGILSVPTQFASYQARLMEQFLGKSLTPMEKARLFLVNSALYGVPVAAGGATGIPYFYDWVRQGLMDAEGIDVNDPIIEALHTGIVSTMLHHGAGLDTNFATSMGPNGFDLLKKVNGDDPNATFLSTLTGTASITGSYVSDLFGAGDKVIDYLTGGEDETMTLNWQDGINIFQNISTVNNAMKLYYAHNFGQWMSKRGTYLGDATMADGFMQFLTGLSPKAVEDAFIRGDYMKQADAAKNQAINEIGKYVTLANRARERGDQEEFSKQMMAARTVMIGAGFRPDEYGKVFTQVMADKKSVVQSTREKWVLNPPPGKETVRRDKYIKEITP